MKLKNKETQEFILVYTTFRDVTDTEHPLLCVKHSHLPHTVWPYLFHANISWLAPQLINLRFSYFSPFFSIIQIVLLFSVLREVQIGLSFLVRKKSAADFLLSTWNKAFNLKWAGKCSAWLGNSCMGTTCLLQNWDCCCFTELIFLVAFSMLSVLRGSQGAFWGARWKKVLPILSLPPLLLKIILQSG